MLDMKFVREHEAELRETIERQKRYDRMEALDTLLKIDEKWRKLKGDVDALRAERNKLSEQVNATKKTGGNVAPILARVKEIPSKIKESEEKMVALEGEMRTLLAKVPNVMHKDVPYGENAEENIEQKRWGEPKKFSFPVKTHVELCEALNIADFEASALTTGNGFYFLKGDLGLLNQALIRYAIDMMLKKGYLYIEPPLMVRKKVLDAAMDSTGFEQSIFRVQTDENLCMIGTAEHAILGMLEGKTLKEEGLPVKCFGYSMCFRQEIGAHGINEKGLWRTHQFNKVEQFIFCTPETTWEAYEELKANSEAILQGLKLPYRIIEICTGDLAVWKARSHDFEVWRPTTQSFGEVMSLSNCTVYQSTDLDIRYVRRNGERGFVHTLNNTALATSRILVAILENCQNADGTITIPEVLQPYMFGKTVIGKN